jgi:hypothetical protein
MITLICMAPGCENPVTPTLGQGPPTRYCSPACRPSFHKKGASRRLTVEIDHEPTENGARPVGRVWFVQLSLGTKHVRVATGLSRPSAEHLAGQLNALLGPGEWAKRGAVE